MRPKGVTDGHPVNIPVPPGDVIRWGDAEGYESRVMDVPIGHYKLVPVGKSAGA